MTPADVLRELALVAVVTTVWTALVMLMLERDRKRMERRDAWTADRFAADSSGAGSQPAPTANKRAGASTPAQEDNREIQPE